MEIDKVIERVKKMIALGNNEGATEAERETALRMAYNILAKYNLSMADMTTEQTEDREEQSVTICGDKWIRSLSVMVSKLFFCKYYFTRTDTSGKDVHTFIGLQTNVITARYMSEYLVRAIKKEAGKRYGSATSPNGRSFGVGSVNSITRRIETMLEQGSEEATPGTAMVLVTLRAKEKDANDAWLAAQGVSVSPSASRSSRIERHGYQAGKEYGNNVSLNQQVGTSAIGMKRIGN